MMGEEPRRNNIPLTGERRVQQYGEGKPGEVETAENLARDAQKIDHIHDLLMRWGILPGPVVEGLHSLMTQYRVTRIEETKGGATIVLSDAECIGHVKREIVEAQMQSHERLTKTRRSF